MFLVDKRKKFREEKVLISGNFNIWVCICMNGKKTLQESKWHLNLSLHYIIYVAFEVIKYVNFINYCTDIFLLVMT